MKFNKHLEAPEVNKDLIGKKAQKKSGYFRGITGILKENPYKITPYLLMLHSENAVAHVNEEDIELVTGEESRKKKGSK